MSTGSATAAASSVLPAARLASITPVTGGIASAATSLVSGLVGTLESIARAATPASGGRTGTPGAIEVAIKLSLGEDAAPTPAASGGGVTAPVSGGLTLGGTLLPITVVVDLGGGGVGTTGSVTGGAPGSPGLPSSNPSGSNDLGSPVSGPVTVPGGSPATTPVPVSTSPGVAATNPSSTSPAPLGQPGPAIVTPTNASGGSSPVLPGNGVRGSSTSPVVGVAPTTPASTQSANGPNLVTGGDLTGSNTLQGTTITAVASPSIGAVGGPDQGATSPGIVPGRGAGSSAKESPLSILGSGAQGSPRDEGASTAPEDPGIPPVGDPGHVNDGFLAASTLPAATPETPAELAPGDLESIERAVGEFLRGFDAMREDVASWLAEVDAVDMLFAAGAVGLACELIRRRLRRTRPTGNRVHDSPWRTCPAGSLYLPRC